MDLPEGIMSNLYDTDFTEWALYNADLLRSGRISEADLENIAEEIEQLARNQGRELKSRITQIIEHLLKLKLTSKELRKRNERGWLGSAYHQREDIRELLEESPSLRRRLTPALLESSYASAARVFAGSFGIQPPDECPFTWEDVLGDVRVRE
jgi:hypothetical protein